MSSSSDAVTGSDAAIGESLSDSEVLADDDTDYAPPSALLERIVALVALALSVALVLGARSIDVRTETGGIDPRWWPTLLGGLAVAFSLTLTVVAFTRPPMDRDGLEAITKLGWMRVLSTIGAAAVFLFLWDLEVNFLIIVAVLLVVLLIIFGSRNWKQLVIFPLIMTGGIWVLFHLLLRVPL